MGNSSPKRSMHCSICYKKDWIKYELGYANLTWKNVVAIKAIGESVLCRCLNCGHEYKSKSISANRSLRNVNN